VARGDEEQIDLGKRIGEREAVLIHGDECDVVGFELENVADIGKPRLLGRYSALFTDQQAGEQIEGVLRAKRDQDLFIGCENAASGQNAAADLLDEQRIIERPGIVGPGAEPFLAERLARAVAPFGEWKEIVVDLAVDEGIGIGLPVERL